MAMKLADRFEPADKQDVHRIPIRFTKEEWVEVARLLDGRPFSLYIRRLLSREMAARARSTEKEVASVVKLVEKLQAA
jgi:hypothetical protein